VFLLLKSDLKKLVSCAHAEILAIPEYWSTGVLEYWKKIVPAFLFFDLMHYSISPPLH